MKRHSYSLLVLILAAAGAARAQVVTAPAPLHRWSFEATGGGAFPAGAFANTEKDDPKSGPVHTGSIFELGGTYHLNHHWGVALLAGAQHDNSHVDNFIIPGPPVPDVVVPGPLTYGATYPPAGPQHWSMTRILAGGVYTFPLNKKKDLTLLFRALAGIQKTHTSQYEYLLEKPNQTAFADFPARHLAWAFAYQADAGLQWKVYRRWSLLALAGYSGSRPAYKQDITPLLLYDIPGPSNPAQTTQTIHFPTGSILVRAGIGFAL